jgi:NitT/TauT family transport system substrate-binding protein
MRLVPARDRGGWHRGRAGRRGLRAAGALGIAAGLLVVAGCRMGGTSPAAAPGTITTITVAATPQVADAPLYIGIRDQLFKDAGLRVTVVPYSSASQQVAHLRNGSADVAFGDYASMFFAQEQKPSPHLLTVADGYDCASNVMEVLTLPKYGISSPGALAGKTIGTPMPQQMPANSGRPYSLETVATWSALSNYNVDPKTVHWDPMPADKLISALQIHQVDAILVTEPTIYQAEVEHGAVPVLDSCTGGTESLPLDGYFSTRSYASTHAAVLNAFRSALAKAQSEASVSAPVQAVLEADAGMTPQAASLVTMGTYPTSLLAGNIQRVANLMFFYNMLPGGPITVAKMVAR